MNQTIEQERAAFALKEIQALVATDIKRSELRSYTSALPAMIHMNGLGQALAFCYAKSKGRSGNAYGAIYGVLSGWLTKDGQPLAPAEANEARDALKRLTAVDLGLYRVAQIEALALMEWIRKFAIAFLIDEETPKGPEGRA